jgi:hypothetical protein
MIRSATSANATTSARRMTGGSSALLSGSGVPAGSSASGRSLGRIRNWLSPRGGERGWTREGAQPDSACSNLRLPQKFHRGNVTISRA